MRLVPLLELPEELKDELHGSFTDVSFDNYGKFTETRPMGSESRAFRYRRFLEKTYTGVTLDPHTFETIRVTEVPIEMVYRANIITHLGRVEVIAIYEIEHICSLSEFD